MGTNPFTARKNAKLVSPVTDRQRSYLADLLRQKAAIKRMPWNEVAEDIVTSFIDKLDKASASSFIDRAKSDNARLRDLFGHLETTCIVTRPRELEEGMYVVGDDVYKVYVTVHGNSQLVAKQLVMHGDQGSFEYVGKAPLRTIEKDGRRLTLEEARAFGALYGQCCRCLAPLTHEVSIALGIGPKCGEHEYADEFKPLYKATRQQLGVTRPEEHGIRSLTPA